MKNILITGGAKRIGKEMAVRFAQDGWNVAIHYNQSSKSAQDTIKTIESIGGKTIAVQADVRHKKEVVEAFEKAFNYLGGIDVLVNNAGIFPARTAFTEISEDIWNNSFDVNLRGEFYFAQAYAQSCNEGRIVNISSVGGVQLWRGRMPYNVSKAAVIQFTKSLALELAPHFSVNCISPGIIQMTDEPSEPISVSPDKIPMKRYGSPDDMYDAVKFFAQASKYITGQVLFVDGAYHLI